jgi:hypothetical protein
MRILILAIFAFFSVPSLADEPEVSSKTEWAGVWSGTIGGLPIMACMQHSEYRDVAAYYYRKHMKIITLTSPLSEPSANEMPQWIEGSNREDAPKSPQWKLSAVDANTLTGTWSALPERGAKALPIALKRVATEPDDDNICGSSAFNAPRVTPVKITRKAAKKDGIAYMDITADVGKQFDVSIGTFGLLGNSIAVQKINAELGKVIPVDPLKSNYLECVTGPLSSQGTDGDYSVGLAPDLITRNYMVSQESYSDYCGGAHPNYSVSWRNWDLRTGAEINLWNWLSPKAVIQTFKKEYDYTEIKIQPALRKILKKKWLVIAEPECRDVINDHDYWKLHLTRNGVAYYPDLAHAITACEADLLFSFTELAPLLSPVGKKALASFRADLK